MVGHECKRASAGSRRVVATALTICALSLAVLPACSASSSSPSSGGTGLPASSDSALDAGRVLIESKCRLCHTLDRIKTANHDAVGWQETVSRMRSNGAVLTDAEAKSIVDYLMSR